MDIQDQFDRDAAEWAAHTAHLSIVSAMVAHPAYQRIMSLGPAAVPLIIERLRANPGHWFWALREIVGTDHAAGARTVPDAARLWVQWYDQEGYITYSKPSGHNMSS